MQDDFNKNSLEKIIRKYERNITGITDLTAERDPSLIFFVLINTLGYLLKNEPEAVLSKNGVRLRRSVNGIIKKLGVNFLSCPQIIENRHVLKDPESNLKDNGIVLPKEPVIWAPNHYFKDDTLASIIASYRHSYILFGSLPQFFNTFDGITAWLNGVVMTNRKVKESKKASVAKAVKAMEYGADLLVFSEGVWNKSPNRLLLDFWPGIYRIAKETGAYVVPMAHYIEDFTNQRENNLIHTVIDDPIRIDDLSEKSGLEYLREVIATWYYLMMERYGQSTRQQELSTITNSIVAWEGKLHDLVRTTDRYDKEIELCADFRPKNILLPETVFEPIANIENITLENIAHMVYADKLVALRKNIDYQRNF